MAKQVAAKFVIPRKTAARLSRILISTAFKSWLKRFRTLPRGVVSKNAIGARITRVMRFSWMTSLATAQATAVVTLCMATTKAENKDLIIK